MEKQDTAEEPIPLFYATVMAHKLSTSM